MALTVPLAVGRYPICFILVGEKDGDRAGEVLKQNRGSQVREDVEAL
jgi:hypothetical protein